MTLIQHQFGDTIFSKVNSGDTLRQVLIDPWLNSETIIIKPNWVSTNPGDFTEVETLRMLFASLEAKFIVTDSYCLSRAMNLLEDGLDFKVGDQEVNWRWLLNSEGWKWLIENSNWDWFKKGGHWDQIRLEEQNFLDSFGFSDLFREFDVTYLNVTEEVWAGRVADPIEVQSAVESRFKPLRHKAFYQVVPSKLHALQGSTFISFARLKMYCTYTMKNIFGMLPEPLKPYWHGHKDTLLNASIIDINKVYQALFNVYGICEALRMNPVHNPQGKYEGLIFYGRYDIHPALGLVAQSRDLLALDAILLSLSDPKQRELVERCRKLVAEAEDEFGPLDRMAIREAKEKAGDWLSPRESVE